MVEEPRISWRGSDWYLNPLTPCRQVLKPEQENNSSWKQNPGLAPPSEEFSAPLLAFLLVLIGMSFSLLWNSLILMCLTLAPSKETSALPASLQSLLSSVPPSTPIQSFVFSPCLVNNSLWHCLQGWRQHLVIECSYNWAFVPAQLDLGIVMVGLCLLLLWSLPLPLQLA